MKLRLLFLIYFNLSITLYGQKLPNQDSFQYKRILISDTILLADWPILPNSVFIFRNNLQLDLALFHIDYIHSKISTEKIINDSLTIYFKTIPLPKWIQNKQFDTSLKKINRTFSLSNLYSDPYSISAQEEENELTYSGTFVRGVTVGNRQDAAINSGFNLQLNGKMANGLEINAAMTDANIPIQPEGNSASIQEFDRIYIQLKKDSHRIHIGDFDLAQISPSQLLVFDRKLQGVQYNTSINLKKNHQLQIGTSAAITRGTFARNIFSAVERNQGPYKLTGNNGETFIIVIAGTERVFINGQLLKRGLENDYTINYNFGEIIFTTNRMITQDLRIVVEFQYADRSYFRYSLEGHSQYSNDKIKLYSQVFTEIDNKNAPINIDLSKTQVQRMAEIGNQIDSALILSESEVSWEASRITYLKFDTIVDNKMYTIYKWAEQKLSPVYQLIFTQLGNQKGNYILRSTSANGIVYQWVPPINGVPQGSFEPIMKFTTPKSHLQWSNGGQFQWSESHRSNLEISYTDHDLNEFSLKDQDKNKGLGLKLSHQIDQSIDSNRKVQIGLSQEYTSATFSPMTRYRNPEFQRNWAIQLPFRNQAEQSQSSILLSYLARDFNTKLASSFFYIPNYYQGSQSTHELLWKKNKFQFLSQQFLLVSIQKDSHTLFVKPKFSSTYSLNPSQSIELGLFHEYYKLSTATRDFHKSSFIWQNYFLNWKRSWSNTNQLNLEYIYRTEQSSDSLSYLSPHTKIHTFSGSGVHEFSNSQSLKYNLKYRNFNSILNEDIAHNYLAKIDYAGHFAQGMFRLSSSYEVKAGREQKQQLVYIKSPNGYGNYAWKDINNNGVFEINEVYVSPFITENNYMKYFIALPEFVPANEISYSQFFWIQPKAIWFDQKGLKNFISKLNYQFRIDIANKTRTNDVLVFSDYIQPFSNFNDSTLIFSRMNMFQQLSFQKNENKIGFDIEWLINQAKNIFSNGVEGVSNHTYALKSRIDLSYYLNYQNRIYLMDRINSSEYFEERNYNIQDYGIENTFSFLVNQNMKLNFNANYSHKRTENQVAKSTQGDIEWKISRKNDGIIETKFSLLNIDYEQKLANDQVELAMLNGLQKGLNYIWNLTLGQKLTKSLQLNLIYNGRKNQNTPGIIHSGNVEVRAIF